MRNLKTATVAALAVALSLGAAATLAAAQDAKPASTQGSGMMGGQGGGGMMGMMGGMDPAQMNRMMENCNRMMESMMQHNPAAPGAPAPDKKG